MPGAGSPAPGRSRGLADSVGGPAPRRHRHRGRDRLDGAVPALPGCRSAARGRLRRLGAVGSSFGVAALFQALAVLAPYGLSGDVFSYAMYGRIFAGVRRQPVPGAADQLRRATRSTRTSTGCTSRASTARSGRISRADRPGWPARMSARRSSCSVWSQAVSALAAAVAVFLLLRHTIPGGRWSAPILIGWCPLVVVESGLSAHNDVLMGLLIVVGLVLAWTGADLASIASVGTIVLAGLVKLTALALLPLLGIYLLRSAACGAAAPRSSVRLGRSLTAALAVAIVLPVWSGPRRSPSRPSAPARIGTSTAWPSSALGELRLLPRRHPRRPGGAAPVQRLVGRRPHRHARSYATRDGRTQYATARLHAAGLERAAGRRAERDGRLRVFDPVSPARSATSTRRDLGPIDPPAEFMADPEIAARSRGPVGARTT